MMKSASAIGLAFGLLLSAPVSRAERMVTVHEDKDLTGEKEITAEIEMSVGEFVLKGAPAGKAVVIDGEYDKREFDYRFSYENRSGTGDLYFDIDGHDGHWKGSSSEDNVWEISLTDKVPVDLKLDIGAAECDLQLGGMMISSFNLDVGAADCEVTFDTPNLTTLDRFVIDAGASSLEIKNLGNARFKELSFDGGVGSYELDFSGTFDFDAEAEISVGMGSVDILIPRDIGVRIFSDDGFMSSIDIPKRAFEEVDDGEFESKNWKEANGHLTITLDIGMGSADIDFTK